ncbi:MAG: 23S rRNA (adenine(2030)-N(6))-methyltransferase RlmJ [Gammaproteobacteria bacterium]|nr:23S rRNA (adenine(2030)-N(6))-methyltransferase RlmJ [Gammaproteobacteria bacterium]MDH5304389.1 23S rRNA (adenine(2030)-N(6))-methyltransferase RlmJ [Gammaproteobacteria bacterium]MDH5322108.1 23S rRNA (adenine(2030)-N(6))-methyltransferase RlmJ [Gammaproteobacteria bacterium]
MLSYRHAYHAGNFADVMKHVVLTSILTYLVRKDAALCYLDTHAGAGAYDLRSDKARKTGESGLGIEKIIDANGAPTCIANYLQLVRGFNTAGVLDRYPGSPWFAAQLLRQQDRLVLCELHNSDFPLLEQLFAKDKRVHCHAVDGYRFSLGLIPPIERRGLVLIDPAYELADETMTAFKTLAKLHRRFAGGTFSLWYPILDEHQGFALRQQFEASQMRDVLHLALRIADRNSLPGMYGSGMIIVNPPWTLRAEMQIALPWLVSQLGVNSRAGCEIEQWVEE